VIDQPQTSSFLTRFAAALVAWSTFSTLALAQPAIFLSPPRTIADITAILDQQKSDAERVNRVRAAADAEPPYGVDDNELVVFYFHRSDARSHIGRLSEAIADLEKGIALGQDHNIGVTQLQVQLGFFHSVLGDNKSALQTFLTIVRQNEKPEAQYKLFVTYRWMSQVYIYLGDLPQAEAYVRKLEALFERYLNSTKDDFRDSNFAQFQMARGRLFEARGQFREAEEAYRLALDSIQLFRSGQWQAFIRNKKIETVIRNNIETMNDNLIASGGRVKARQGRFAEGEADARRALLSRLSLVGKYDLSTTRTIPYLSTILIEQGRYEEAEKLTRTTIEIYLALGASKNSLAYASNLSELGTILGLEKHWSAAAKVYADLEGEIVGWEPTRRADLLLTPARVYCLYKMGNLQMGIAEASAMVTRLKVRNGEDHFDYAVARGMLAVGYALAGRDADAIDEFKTAIPVMMATSKENADEDDPTLVAARRVQLQRIVEGYIDVLARTKETAGGVAMETFALADAIRGHAVQQSLADASARAVAKDPALAQLVRTEQDDAKQISAELGALNNLLSLPSGQRDEQSVQAINVVIEKLRADRRVARQEINREFPAYGNLVNPKPPSVDEIKATLRPGEALLSFYFGQDASFVWAVPKDGAVAFASVPLKAIDLAAKVHKLRQALEPDFTLVSEIPAFDLTLAYELYGLLLKPVEAAWGPSKSLIVVTNGALGELPLGLLPTAPAQVDVHIKPLYAGYRDVKWLARSHAITVLPSASALVTLRHLPPGSATREKLIGFGDPYFNEQQAAEAETLPPAETVEVAAADQPGADAVTRGLPLKRRASPHTEDVDTAELAMLPRLPDTRLELTTIAKVLNVDPAKALYLGKAANEQNVETMDLSRFQVVAFATHGLVPGDIDGLTQPALALTAPQVAGVKGNGLLTMEKILALKLDADWVVLSACNTAAGAGAGAEAVSGLGSAFFYAGTRALLVTNWPVESASARELTSDLFRRVAADQSLTRAEALRQAMMAVLDGPGSVDSSGNTDFTYAHPLFWAPYSLIGDGGGS